jgi:hypothetical protein
VVDNLKCLHTLQATDDPKPHAQRGDAEERQT